MANWQNFKAYMTILSKLRLLGFRYVVPFIGSTTSDPFSPIAGRISRRSRNFSTYCIVELLRASPSEQRRPDRVPPADRRAGVQEGRGDGQEDRGDGDQRG